MAPLYAQRPIAIGCLLLGNDLMPIRLGCIGAKKHGNDDRKILSDWADYMARERPVIVSWNGRGFDLPVLMLRSFRWGIPLRWYFAEKNYRYRYSEDNHIDLMDVMSDYGAAGRKGFKLDGLARAIGLPGKYGIDGSLVQRYYEDGRLDEIETYCLTDVIQTSFVFLRWLLVKGKIELSAYQRSAAALYEHCLKESRFHSFVELIDHTALVLESPPMEDQPPSSDTSDTSDTSSTSSTSSNQAPSSSTNIPSEAQ